MKLVETNVLFVSASNACRSLLAEACLRQLGQGKFKVFSCGIPAHSKGQPDSAALLALQTAGIPTADLRCKGWAEFTRIESPKMEFVIFLDAASFGEQPSWRGQPETALWDYPLFIARKGQSTDRGLAAVQTLMSLRRRIELLVSLHSKVKHRSDFRDDLRSLAYV